MKQTTTRLALAAMACMALALTSCSSDEDSSTASDASEETDAAPSEATSDQESGEGEADNTDQGSQESDVIEVEMSDFTYDGLPERVPAGTEFAVSNNSASELHELVAIRLPDGEDRSLEELLALPPEESAGILGMPETVLLAAPGGLQIAAVGDGTLNEPGRYAIICAIPTGADPQTYLDAAAESGGPPSVPGGPPHFANGMYAEVIVE